MLRLDRQRLEAHRRREDAALHPPKKRQPLDGAEQGAGSSAGTAGADDRRRTRGAAPDGGAKLSHRPGGGVRPEKARVWSRFRAFPPLYQRIRGYNIAFYKNRDPEAYERALSHLIQETKRGQMFGEWNDYGRLLESGEEAKG